MARQFLKPESIDIIVYHAPCMDGSASAFVAHKFNPNYQFIAWDLKSEEGIVNTRNKRFAFIDCAPSPELYDNLDQRNNVILVLDHHIGNKRIWDGTRGCFFDMTKSGCMLAWEYFFPDQPIPPILRHIGLRDLWIFDDTLTRPIGYALIDMPSIDFRTLGDLNIDELVAKGHAITSKIDAKISSLEARDVKLLGTEETALVVDVHDYRFISECAHAILEKHPGAPYVIAYYKTDQGAFKLSFRADKEGVDVSLIAQRYGGNGHAKAAGATVDVLPF